MIEALDQQLREIAQLYGRQFHREHGSVTTADELQSFMAVYDPTITVHVSGITQQTLLMAAIEGVDNLNILVEEIQRAKAKTITYLWRQIAALRRPAFSTASPA